MRLLPFVLCALALLFTHLAPALAQEPAPLASPEPSSGTLTLGGFVDAYYARDFGDPANNQRPGFLFNHTRHDEFTINIAMLTMGYERERVRAKLGLQAGTYAQYNYAAEPDLLKPIFEAWGGVQLTPDIWWDVGIFPSHLGWESAISLDNLTLTRSIAAESSPYFLAGTRLYWTPNEEWSLGVTLANGWQNIIETNDSKGAGTQVSWSPEGRFLINSSTWISDESTTDDSRLRLFHDLYASAKLLEKYTLIAGLDTGMQQTADGAEDDWNVWWSAAIIAHADLNTRLAAAARLEYFHDPAQVIIATNDPDGFSTLGASLNLDVKLLERALFRVEGRLFRDANTIYALGDDDTSRVNVAATASLAIAFDHVVSGPASAK